MRMRMSVLRGRQAVGALLVLTLLLGACSESDGTPARPDEPSGSPRTSTSPSEPIRLSETIPTEPPDEIVVRRRHGLEVAGEIVPGRWQLSDYRGDVWVAIKTAEDGYESQWWGKGTRARPTPPSPGSVLRGPVVISQDARWIVWTRPAGNIYGRNPRRVMEVVDTTTGKVRWSRNADADGTEPGVLEVTNDGVVVFEHCLEPSVDAWGVPQCGKTRVDVWAPRADVTVSLSAAATEDHPPFPDTVSTLVPPLLTGRYDGVLVRSAGTARPHYVRLRPSGRVDWVASLPRDTVAVTADERFALLGEKCSDGLPGCGWSVLSLEDRDRRELPPLTKALGIDRRTAAYATFSVETDDLMLVRLWGRSVLGRCSLAQVRCVPIAK